MRVRQPKGNETEPGLLSQGRIQGKEGGQATVLEAAVP